MEYYSTPRRPLSLPSQQSQAQRTGGAACPASSKQAHPMQAMPKLSCQKGAAGERAFVEHEDEGYLPTHLPSVASFVTWPALHCVQPVVALHFPGAQFGSQAAQLPAKPVTV